MSSSRKLKRVNLVSELQVRDAGTDEPIGVTFDISTEGVGVRGPSPLKVGDISELVLSLPAEIKGLTSVEITGRCTWCKRDDNPDLYRIGFEFVDGSDENVVVIDELIRRFKRVEVPSPKA